MKLFLNNCLLLLACSLLWQCKKDDVEETPPTENYADSIKRDLWAHFDFNGNLTDLSGRNHNMVAVNGATFGYDTWGAENRALELDGVNDYAVIDSGKVFPDGNFTVSFLMMPRAIYGRPFQKANPNDAKGASFGFGYDDDGRNGNLVFNTTKDPDICNKITDVNNSTPLNITKRTYPYAWYYVAIVYDNGVQRVYYNGELVATQTRTDKTFKNCPNAPFYFGIWWVNDLHAFNGKLDELRIHTRALSVKEIEYLYNNLP